MVSPFLRLMKGVSKSISSVSVFSIWIIILLLEDCMDSIVAVWVCFVVWDRRIRSKMPRRDRMNVIFWSFILFGIL